MPSYAAVRRITILRAPVDVLKSAQKMALLQHFEGNPAERKLNNSFCQHLAGDTFNWLSKCPLAAEGTDSILRCVIIGW